MIFFIFLIKISFSYNLYSFKNTSSIFLNRNAIYGPITLSKNITLPPIIISSDGSILFKDRCSKISIYKLNQYTSSDIFFSEIHEPYLLSKFSNQIKNLKRYFLAKWGIQISWKNHLINTKGTFNSFQMFLLSNGFEYFAIFNFEKISKEYDFFMGYHNSICQNFSFLPIFNSGFLLQKSNVKKKGLWVFELNGLFETKNDGIKLIKDLNFLIILFIINSLFFV